MSDRLTFAVSRAEAYQRSNTGDLIKVLSKGNERQTREPTNRNLIRGRGAEVGNCQGNCRLDRLIHAALSKPGRAGNDSASRPTAC